MFSKARFPIRKLFTDVCTITNNSPVVDEFGSTTFEEVVVCDNEPCRISYSSFQNAEDSQNGASDITQNIKLFIREDLTILAGSKISVTRGNNTTIYSASGVPAIHSNHQEINLQLVKKYA